MEEKVLKFERGADVAEMYCRVADKRNADGDYVGELSAFFSALNAGDYRSGAEMLANIADAYARMELYEQSNQYWFYCLDRNFASGKASESYRELAANFYCMDDLWTAGYYLSLKADADKGFSGKEGDEEIIEALYNETDITSAYHLAYPFDRADYSEAKRRAHRAFGAGSYGAAAALYESIPAECRDEDSFGELAMAYFFMGKDDKAEQACRDSAAYLGNNLTAYCNMSTICKEIHEPKKSRFYYDMALQLRKGGRDEDFKIASCAIEQKDYVTASGCLKKTLEERPYDVMLRFYYGINFINLYDFEKGAEQLGECYRLCPDDEIFKWYCKFAARLTAGEKKALSLLPLKYDKQLPLKAELEYEKAFAFALDGKKRLNKTELVAAARVCAFSQDDATAKTALIVISEFDAPRAAQKFLKELLLGVSVREELKSFAIYLLVATGCKDRVGVLAGKFYVSVKLRKSPFDDGDEFSRRFTAAYALCVSGLVFSGITETDKALFALNELYKNRREDAVNADLKPDELAAIAVANAGFQRVKSVADACRIFDVKQKRVAEFTKPAKPVKGE